MARKRSTPENSHEGDTHPPRDTIIGKIGRIVTLRNTPEIDSDRPSRTGVELSFAGAEPDGLDWVEIDTDPFRPVTFQHPGLGLAIDRARQRKNAADVPSELHESPPSTDGVPFRTIVEFPETRDPR